MGIVDARLTIIDLINGKTKILEAESDHKAISFIVSLRDIGENAVETRPPRQNYIRNIPHNRNLTNEEIDEWLIDTEKYITKTMEKTIPRSKTTNSMDKYINKKIKRLRKDKSYLITLLNRRRTELQPWQIETTKETISRIRYLITKEFSIAVNKFWERQASEIDYKKHKQFFPKINKMFRRREGIEIENLKIPSQHTAMIKRSGALDMAQREEDGSYSIRDPIKKLDLLGAHFEEVNALSFLNTGTRLKELVDAKATEFRAEEDQNSRLTVFSDENPAHWPRVAAAEEEYSPLCNWIKVRWICQHLPNKTSTGPDEIPAIVIKHLPANIIITYTVIFNNAFNNNYFPKAWKKTKTIPIKKKDKDHSSPASYRPINLAPNISKVFEALIKEEIENECKKRNLIPNNQFGFRFAHSTEHAIAKLTTDICRHLNNNEIVAACLLDIEKAFDTIWHNGLIYKLLKKVFPTQLIRLIVEMIEGQEFVVSDGVKRSENTYRVREGLQQGRVCSPTLFSIYNDGINMADLNSDNNTYSIAFADDEIVYVAGKSTIKIKEKLQELVEKRNRHHRMWNLKLNPIKCETIIFRKPYNFLSKNIRTGLKNFNIAISTPHSTEPNKIPHKDTVKYLGVHMDHLLRMNKHIDTQLMKANRAVMANSKLFHNKHMPKRAKVICYQLLIRPILTYAPTACRNVSASTVEKLRRFERKCLRACLNMYRSQKTEYKHFISNQQLLNEANISRIDNHILKLIRMSLSRYRRSDNKIIEELSTCSEEYADKCMKTGYIPIAAFSHIDAKDLIQDGQNRPILYHGRRNRADKSIPPDFSTTHGQRNPMRYNKSISEVDVNDFHRTSEELWWRAGNARQLDELRRRKRIKEAHI